MLVYYVSNFCVLLFAFVYHSSDLSVVWYVLDNYFILTVHSLSICARETSEAECKARKGVMGCANFPVSSSVLHWRPILSRFYPRFGQLNKKTRI